MAQQIIELAYQDAEMSSLQNLSIGTDGAIEDTQTKAIVERFVKNTLLRGVSFEASDLTLQERQTGIVSKLRTILNNARTEYNGYVDAYKSKYLEYLQALQDTASDDVNNSRLLAEVEELNKRMILMMYIMLVLSEKLGAQNQGYKEGINDMNAEILKNIQHFKEQEEKLKKGHMRTESYKEMVEYSRRKNRNRLIALVGIILANLLGLGFLYWIMKHKGAEMASTASAGVGSFLMGASSTTS